MKYENETIEYNKLFDAYLVGREDVISENEALSIYIINEQELKIVKKIFDVIFTNEIDNSTVFSSSKSGLMQITSIEFPSELVNFIKGFKSINDKKKFIDQFRLNALLYIFDTDKGHNGLRDFFRYKEDILKLKDFFSIHKAKIIDFLHIQNMHLILSFVEKNDDGFIIDDIDYFIENIARSVGMARHAEINTFVVYEYSNMDREFIENVLNKYFIRSEDEVIEGEKSELINFIEDVTGKTITKNLLEFLRVFSMNEDDFEKYMTDNQIADSRYFLELEKNTLYKNISTYDMNPLFLMHGNTHTEFDFKIPIEYVEISNYIPVYRWEKQVNVLRNIASEIRDFTAQSSQQKGEIYEKHVIKILEENYGYILEEHTGGSGDGGVDLIMIDIQEKRVAIQCKFSSKKLIGSRVVGEIHKGKDLKKADYGMICSNRAFTSQCQDEAFELGIKLERIAFE
jgi:hypothetical protein